MIEFDNSSAAIAAVLTLVAAFIRPLDGVFGTLRRMAGGPHLPRHCDNEYEDLGRVNDSLLRTLGLEAGQFARI